MPIIRNLRRYICIGAFVFCPDDSKELGIRKISQFFGIQITSTRMDHPVDHVLDGKGVRWSLLVAHCPKTKHWLDAIVSNLFGHDLVPNGDNVWTPKVTKVFRDKSVTVEL